MREDTEHARPGRWSERGEDRRERKSGGLRRSPALIIGIRAGAALLVVMTASCIFLKRTIETDNLTAWNPQRVESPVRVHLVDGSTALFKEGAVVERERVSGRGWRYGLNLRDSVQIDALAVDSIVAMEAYRHQIDGSASLVYSVIGTAVAIGSVIGLACAADPKCFGSCPTVYSDSSGTAVLEAEGFSYSIAPLFESRDIDRLRATPDESGIVRLEIRNEALETHYINHLELFEAVHAEDERVLPASDGRIIAARALRSPLAAIDRAGRSVRAQIEAHDGAYFQTAPAVLAAATAEDLDDVIDLDLGDLGSADSIVLVFRMRNSLLATILFYDLMLGDRGARALDWLAFDLERLSTAVELGEWSRAHLGMQVSVTKDGAFEHVGRVGDSGPVAWKDVTIVIPAPDPKGRVRLTFPADGWRIDWLAFSTDWREVEPRILPLTRVATSTGELKEAHENLSRADTRYLMTSPGQWFSAEFDVGVSSQARTVLLASQGYYIEWIRREWLLTGRETTAFQPGRASLVDAIQRWATVQDSLEKRFYATRVPVR